MERRIYGAPYWTMMNRPDSPAFLALERMSISSLSSFSPAFAGQLKLDGFLLSGLDRDVSFFGTIIVDRRTVFGPDPGDHQRQGSLVGKRKGLFFPAAAFSSCKHNPSRHNRDFRPGRLLHFPFIIKIWIFSCPGIFVRRVTSFSKGPGRPAVA